MQTDRQILGSVRKAQRGRAHAYRRAANLRRRGALAEAIEWQAVAVSWHQRALRLLVELELALLDPSERRMLRALLASLGGSCAVPSIRADTERRAYGEQLRVLRRRVSPQTVVTVPSPGPFGLTLARSGGLGRRHRVDRDTVTALVVVINATHDERPDMATLLSALPHLRAAIAASRA